MEAHKNRQINPLVTKIISVIKSRMRWVGQVARMGYGKCIIFWLRNLKGRHQLEDLGVDRQITLDRILGK
jgi:hypothetical protein